MNNRSSFTGTGYYFDAQGTLVGVVTNLSDTTPFTCPPGYMVFSYGTICDIVFAGPFVDLCAGGAGGASGTGGAASRSGAGGAGGA